jgi:hypothetical protein
MGDSSETIQQSRSRQIDKECARRLLGQRCLHLDNEDMPWILNHIDCFVSQSRVNARVEEVRFWPISVDVQDDDVWDKVGQAIGNLQALKSLSVSAYSHDSDDDSDYEQARSAEMLNPDWKILTRILSHVRQNVGIKLEDYIIGEIEEVQMQALARAIRGHPTITSFDSSFAFSYETTNSLYSALATLPALESIVLSSDGLHTRPEDESALAHHESLGRLLRVPSLRFVCFCSFSFTPALCQSIVNAFMEGTVFPELEFTGCSFSDGECAGIMANGLARNRSVSCITVQGQGDEAIKKFLAAALPLNSTLQELSFESFEFKPFDNDPDTPVDWSPIFSALGKNMGLKTLKLGGFGSMGESLCTAMTDGFGLNETLENLELTNAILCDDRAALWCRALSFLCTNKALKSLVVNVQHGVTDSSLSAFRIDIAAMLQDSASLESLSIRSTNAIRAEEYVAFVTSLQQNTTLKSLNFEGGGSPIRLTVDEDKQIAALLQKNYALESLPGIDPYWARDMAAILLLNKVGRRYLIEDGSSISKGVDVLSAVSKEINCVFLHLVENPRLCDRSAVEVASDMTEGARGSANPANHNRKRGQGQRLEEGKESRRRRT